MKALANLCFRNQKMKRLIFLINKFISELIAMFFLLTDNPS